MTDREPKIRQGGQSSIYLDAWPVQSAILIVPAVDLSTGPRSRRVATGFVAPVSGMATVARPKIHFPRVHSSLANSSGVSIRSNTRNSSTEPWNDRDQWVSLKYQY
jgi:hypothetical protein